MRTQAIVNADYHDTIRTIIFTGRPMRVLKSEYIMKWENDRQNEIKDLTAKVRSINLVYNHLPILCFIDCIVFGCCWC